MTDPLLRAYLAPSGQWSGIVLEGGVEIARLADYECIGNMETDASEIWPGIEVEPSEEAKAFWASFAGKPNTDP